MSDMIAPNDAFMKAFHAATQPVEGNPAVRLWADKVLLEIEPRNSRDEIEIHGMEALQRGKGYGTQAMNILKGFADEFGVAMKVDAIALDKDALNRSVVNFYRKAGFGEPRSIGNVMWREPGEEPRAPSKEKSGIAAGPVAF